MQESSENKPVMDRMNRRVLYEAAKKLNLVEFIERCTSASFSKRGGRYVCSCPMPWHNEKDPSFGVSEMSDGAWVYHCFGCDSKGTIIDFCKEYFSLHDPYEALLLIVDKSGLKDMTNIMTAALAEAKVRVDLNKHLECQHFVAASNCRRLLREKFDESRQWVAGAYWEMNKMLKDENVDGIRAIGAEAIEKLAGRIE